MKTWKRALALVLALVMALSLVALPSFAEGEEESAGNGSPRVVYEGASGENNGGLVMSKTVTKGEGGRPVPADPGGFRHRHYPNGYQGDSLGYRLGSGHFQLYVTRL